MSLDEPIALYQCAVHRLDCTKRLFHSMETIPGPISPSVLHTKYLQQVPIRRSGQEAFVFLEHAISLPPRPGWVVAASQLPILRCQRLKTMLTVCEHVKTIW